MLKSLKLFIVLIPLVSIFGSCSESFNILDAKTFNEQIANRTDIKTPDELIKLYYNYKPEKEGKQKLLIQTIHLGENKYKVTLIHEGLLDDSMSSIKIVMIVKQTGLTWIVIEIKENWKCWKDRGHTNWGTALCS